MKYLNNFMPYFVFDKKYRDNKCAIPIKFGIIVLLSLIIKMHGDITTNAIKSINNALTIFISYSIQHVERMSYQSTHILAPLILA